MAQEYKSNVLLLSYAITFNISILLTVTFIAQGYSENALLASLKGSNCYENAVQCYVVRQLFILFGLDSEVEYRSAFGSLL